MSDLPLNARYISIPSPWLGTYSAIFAQFTTDLDILLAAMPGVFDSQVKNRCQKDQYGGAHKQKSRTC